MFRGAARVDANHARLVKELRKLGISVQSLAAVGNGVPDLLCGWRGANYLVEVKNPDMPPSKRELTDDEKEWHQGWRGRVMVALTLDDVLKELGIQR